MDIGVSFNKRECGGEMMYRVLSDIGYKAIDLCIPDVENDEYYFGTEEEAIKLAKEEKARLDKLGLYVNQVHGPWRYPPRDATPEERAEVFKNAVRAIVVAWAFGAKYMVIHPIMPFGAETMPPEKKEENYLINREFYARLAEAAGKYNVIVCLENMPMKGYGITKPTEVAELVKDINSESLKICLDTGHAILLDNVDLIDEIYKCGDLIKTLHIHDNKSVLDDHTFPYFGDIDWAGVAKALRDTGFDGVFSLETDNPNKLPVELQKEVYALYFHIAQYIVKQITE